MPIDSTIMGVIVLVAFLLLMWWVISRAKRGYQALSQVMELAASARSEAAATASNSVNVHVGHAVGSGQNSAFAGTEDYEQEVRRRVRAFEAQAREALAHETLGLAGSPLSASLDRSYDHSSVTADDVRHALLGARVGDRFSQSERGYLSAVGSDSDADSPDVGGYDLPPRVDSGSRGRGLSMLGRRRGNESDGSEGVPTGRGSGGLLGVDQPGAGHDYDDRDVYDSAANVLDPEYNDDRGAFDYFDPEWRERNLRSTAVRFDGTYPRGWAGGGVDPVGPHWRTPREPMR